MLFTPCTPAHGSSRRACSAPASPCRSRPTCGPAPSISLRCTSKKHCITHIDPDQLRTLAGDDLDQNAAATRFAEFVPRPLQPECVRTERVRGRLELEVVFLRIHDHVPIARADRAVAAVGRVLGERR